MILETREHSNHETKVIAKSMFTGRIAEMVIPLPLRAVTAGLQAIKTQFIQQAFPTLNAEQREFIKTGVTPEEWKEVFGDEED